MRLVLFGPPGAGKGTQAALLTERYGLKHVSTGDLIRVAINAGTRLGEEAKKYINDGRLLPDFMVRHLAEEALVSSGCDNFVLDGYPRTVVQAEWLQEFMNRRGTSLDAVIDLVLSEDVIVERLSRRRVNRVTGESYHLDHKPPPAGVKPEDIIQRPDDAPEAIRQRLEIYRTLKAPVEEYYRERGCLYPVDAEGDVEEIFQRISAVISRVTHETTAG